MNEELEILIVFLELLRQHHLTSDIKPSKFTWSESFHRQSHLLQAIRRKLCQLHQPNWHRMTLHYKAKKPINKPIKCKWRWLKFPWIVTKKILEPRNSKRMRGCRKIRWATCQDSPDKGEDTKLCVRRSPLTFICRCLCLDASTFNIVILFGSIEFFLIWWEGWLLIFYYCSWGYAMQDYDVRLTSLSQDVPIQCIQPKIHRWWRENHQCLDFLSS